MNFRKGIFTIIAAMAVQPAAAQLVTLIDAIELSPDNMILPGSLNGMVTFKPCAGECDSEHERARLTEDTAFYVDDKAVKFADFRKDYAVIRQSRDAYALISVDTRTRTITSIRIQG